MGRRIRWPVRRLAVGWVSSCVTHRFLSPYHQRDASSGGWRKSLSTIEAVISARRLSIKIRPLLCKRLTQNAAGMFNRVISM
jgi:hypothetical protein